MIMATIESVEIGQTLYGLWRYEQYYAEQPFTILGTATREDYLAEHQLHLNEHDYTLMAHPDIQFYHISVD